MKSVGAICVALVLAGCTTTTDYSAKAKQVMDPPMNALHACGERFYSRYQHTRSDAASIGLAYDSFCAREQTGVRRAVDDYFKGTGVGVDYANAKGDEMVADQRNLVVGRILRNVL